jgi:hypothetical protein
MTVHGVITVKPERTFWEKVRAADHRYDRAVPGTFRLVPTADMRQKLAADYERMSAMIFGTAPRVRTH